MPKFFYRYFRYFSAHKDAVAGLMTVYSTEKSLEFQNGTISGQITIPGAQNSKITSLLLPIIEDGTERLILVNKSKTGISVGDIADEFGNCKVDFDSVEIEEAMVLPSFNDTDFMAQARLAIFTDFFIGSMFPSLAKVQSLEDYYNLLISAAQLGLLKRSFNAMLGVQALKGFGNQKMIKTELVKTQMSRLQGIVKNYAWVSYNK